MSPGELPEPARRLSELAREDAAAVHEFSANTADRIVGFHAQQAVEKHLKAVMFAKGIRPARTHDIRQLLEELDAANVTPPSSQQELIGLTVYAVPLRYGELPDPEPLDRQATVALVDEVAAWADEQLAAT